MRVEVEGKKKIDPVKTRTSRAKRTRSDGEVGSALRAAYQSAVDEKIPPEMLDLLGKLS